MRTQGGYPATIEGDLYLDTTLLPQDIITDEGTVTGSRISQDLSAAVADGVAAAAVLALATPTQSFATINSSLTINGFSGDLNVIAIASLDYAASSATTPLTLTLNGLPGELFLLNIAGKFDFGPAGVIEGVDPSQVLVNILTGNTSAQTGANSYIGGTILAAERKIALQGVSGPVLGGYVSEISLVGGGLLRRRRLASTWRSSLTGATSICCRDRWCCWGRFLGVSAA